MVCREKAYLENYSIKKTLSTTQKVEIIDKKEFVVVALIEYDKTSVLYMV